MRAAHRSSVFAGPRAAQSTITSLVMAMLLAWTPGRLEAEVIDDFDGARKYSVHGEGAVPEIEVVDGQLKSSRLRDGGFIGIYYPRNYLIPEGRPIEFRLDVLHLNADSAYAAVVVEFPPHRLVADTRTWFHYYGLYWQHTHLYLIRQSPTGEMRLVDATLPRVTVPVTITLSLSRNGTAMELRALVVQRDNPAEVVFDRAVTDRGAPFPDPVEMVTVGIGDTDASGGRTECIVDNLVCSDDAVSLPLGVQRTANGGVTLGWQGHRVPLEADSVQGPWTPVLEPITIGTAARSLLLVPGRERRFFQLVPGWQAADFFNDNTYGWQTAATVPGRVWKPLLGLSGGRARILGEGLHNE